ncbi:MAG TPA: hypothetical protein VGA80_08270 [Flavobacteriaceae bacterium]
MVQLKKLISTIQYLVFGPSPKPKGNGPVQWRFAAKKVEENTYSIHLMAFIESPWQLFTKQLNTSDGSLLNIELESNVFVIIMDKHQEIGIPIEQYDLALKEEIRSYRVAVNFVQTVMVIVHEPITIKGTIHYVIGDGIAKIKTYKKDFKIALNE